MTTFWTDFSEEEGPNLTQKPSKTAAPVWNAMIILGSEEILTSPTCLPLDARMAYREMHGSSIKWSRDRVGNSHRVHMHVFIFYFFLNWTHACVLINWVRLYSPWILCSCSKECILPYKRICKLRWKQYYSFFLWGREGRKIIPFPLFKNLLDYF